MFNYQAQLAEAAAEIDRLKVSAQIRFLHAQKFTPCHCSAS